LPIFGWQLARLQSRLAAVHSAQLLSDEEYFVAEDLCADYLELQSSMGGAVVTAETAVSNDVADKLRRIVGLSEGVALDVSFARQAQRKYLS
jgi:hypothetical protein